MRNWLALLLWIPAGLWGQPPASLPQTWQAVAALSREDTIMVVLTEGRVVEGRFQSISPESLVLESKNQVRSLLLPSVKKVSVKRKASRAKTGAIGAAIGFGIGFPIGAAAAGHLTDRNNPKFTTRAGMGAGVGLLGAGIAAGVGALAGGSRFETVYRDR
jgi:hypothetical protein